MKLIKNQVTIASSLWTTGAQLKKFTSERSHSCDTTPSPISLFAYVRSGLTPTALAFWYTTVASNQPSRTRCNRIFPNVLINVSK